MPITAAAEAAKKQPPVFLGAGILDSTGNGHLSLIRSLCSYFFIFFYLFIYVFERQKERDNSHPLVHSPGAYNTCPKMYVEFFSPFPSKNSN